MPGGVYGVAAGEQQPRILGEQPLAAGPDERARERV